MYFPPAGGGGVQRSLKLAQYLPALGIETHVLAPDDPKWVHRDPELRVPDAGVDPSRALPRPARAEAGRGAPRRRRARARARPGAGDGPAAARAGRERDVEPHRDPGRDPDRAPRGDRRRDHDVAARLGALRRRRRAEGDGRALARRPPRSARREPASPRGHDGRARAAGGERAGRAARRAPRRRGLVRLGGDRRRGARARPRGRRPRRSRTAATSTTSPGSSTRPAPRFRITHAGSFFGKRDPRPFLQAFTDSGLDAVARFVGDFRSTDREWAETLELGDRLELVPYAPRAESLRLQRDSEALLLLVPDAGGRGKGVLSGKVFEYLAARPPDPRGRAARRRRRGARPRDAVRGSSSRRTTSTGSARRSRCCTRASSTAACLRSSSPSATRDGSRGARASRRWRACSEEIA